MPSPRRHLRVQPLLQDTEWRGENRLATQVEVPQPCAPPLPQTEIPQGGGDRSLHMGKGQERVWPRWGAGERASLQRNVSQDGPGAIRVQARASLLGFFSPSLSRVIYQVNCHLETWKELGFFVSENLGFYTLSLARAGTNSAIPLGLVFPFYKQRCSSHRVAIRIK